MKRKKTPAVEVQSDIMSISRLRMGTDGAGVSTLVAFYGCPLKCEFCINNECHEEAHGCYSGPKRASFTPKELVDILKKDEIYYLMSGGGVVFGGGEPLLQSEYIHKVCELIDPKWNVRIETSLNVPWENIEPLISDIDEWIIDIKDMDDDIYELYTGVPIVQMRENLLQLKDYVPKEKIHVRIPRIAGYNSDDEIQYSANWILGNIGVESEVFSYLVLPHKPMPPKHASFEIPDFLKKK